MTTKTGFINSLSAYYQLTKPGIIRGNVLTAIAGFCVASVQHFNILSFLEMLVGLSLIIASACVANNILDRPIDRMMERTKCRPLLDGRVSLRAAVILSTATLVLGSYLLYRINIKTLLLALSGHFLYVVIYGIGKRRTVWSTVIGSLSGAVPPVVGYVAASGRIDGLAGLLFLALVFWQMPHFYAIAMYRIDDYRSAGVPLLPIVRGEARTKRSIIAYIAGYLVIVSLLGFRLHSLIVTVALATSAVWWLSKVRNSTTRPSAVWAKQMFYSSLLVIMIFCLSLSIYGVVSTLYNRV